MGSSGRQRRMGGLHLHRFSVSLKPGWGFVLSGPLELEVPSGRAEIWGVEREELEVGEPGIPVLVRALEESRIEVWSLKPPSPIEDIVPREWEDISSSLVKGDVVMLIGDVDVGKSSLFTFLANRAILSGLRVALLDSDVGQSDIGPVGTIGLAVVESPIVHPSLVEPRALYFIGDSTPRGHLVPMVVGAGRLASIARREADLVLVNTTGFVRSGPARCLKRYKMEAVGPNKVVLVQRGSEVEHISKLVPRGSEVIRICLLYTSPSPRDRG